MLLAVLLSSFVSAGECPSVAVQSETTQWDADRVWLHEPGWFPTLDDPSTVPLDAEPYRANEPLMVIGSRAYPVRAMAVAHVSNDVIDGTPIVATY